MKTEDPLENFIRQHRDAFDDQRAPQHVWRKIKTKQPASVPMYWKWSAIAASMLLLLSVGYILGNHTDPGENIQGWAEFKEAESYYQSRIQAKMEEMKALEVSDDVLTDIQVLDEVYADLKKQLLENPGADSQRLLAAMIKHQKQKLDVMDAIMERVNKYPSQVKQQTNEM